jgi:hypothetical protein
MIFDLNPIIHEPPPPTVTTKDDLWESVAEFDSAGSWSNMEKDTGHDHLL